MGRQWHAHTKGKERKWAERRHRCVGAGVGLEAEVRAGATAVPEQDTGEERENGARYFEAEAVVELHVAVTGFVVRKNGERYDAAHARQHRQHQTRRERARCFVECDEHLAHPRERREQHCQHCEGARRLQIVTRLFGVV